MRCAVLAYHSQNISGNDYRSNDHAALREDLHLLSTLGRRLVSLRTVVDALDSRIPPQAVDGCITVTCDDGTSFDWYDQKHPYQGMQRSFANVIKDYASLGGFPTPALTAFVIASPVARAEIDRGCYEGNPYNNDSWWPEAAKSGRIAIENHSWDHTHVFVTTIAQREQRKGTFLGVETWEDADAQIRQAADFIDARVAPQRTTLFAYPYGEASDYLVNEYFPRFRSQHRVRAAFTTEPEILTQDSCRWLLPRFVCGAAWCSPQDLERLLKPLLR